MNSVLPNQWNIVHRDKRLSFHEDRHWLGVGAPIRHIISTSGIKDYYYEKSFHRILNSTMISASILAEFSTLSEDPPGTPPIESGPSLLRFLFYLGVYGGKNLCLWNYFSSLALVKGSHSWRVILLFFFIFFFSLCAVLSLLRWHYSVLLSVKEKILAILYHVFWVSNPQFWMLSKLYIQNLNSCQIRSFFKSITEWIYPFQLINRQ